MALCSICAKHTDNKCGTCQSIFYCSSICQKKDWALHKLLCGKYLSFLKTRPLATEVEGKPVSYKLAILMHQHRKTPQFIWLLCKRGHDALANLDSPEEEKASRNYSILYGLSSFIESPASTRVEKDGYKVKIWWDCDRKDLNENLCIKTLNEGYEECMQGKERAFRGNINDRHCFGSTISTRYISINRRLGFGPTKYYHDVTLADLRHFYEYSVKNTIFESNKPNPYYIRDEGEWLDAVKISCEGDIRFMGKKEYRKVTISKSHEIFLPDKNAKLLATSRHLGFPLLALKFEFDSSWSLKIDAPNDEHGIKNDLGHPGANLALPHMMISTNNDETWGKVIGNENEAYGYTTLVAREDKKDITIHQVEALSRYCEALVNHAVDALSEADCRTRQQYIDQYLLPDRFDQFFAELKRKKLSEGDLDWVDAIPLLRGS